MKKNNGFLAGLFTLLMVFTGCTNNNSNADNAQIDAEKAKIQSSLTLTSAYNDTLKMVYDTVKVHHNNLYCIKYDKLYHKNDSMFTIHYNMFGDDMYKNGIMMQHYTSGNGMMQGSMMNNGSTGYYQMMSDTATVGGYYRNMMRLHIQHQTYHNAIYN
ncbi:MAG: hypothetical protein PHT07_16260 [Paludibacter sp.]|nr:hypothetical protein [Paludibacter sp.]